MMEHLNMQSMDKVAANVAKIRELFPNCVTERINKEGKLEHAIDFDMLKQELSDHVVDGLQERYQFTWPDKRKAILAANAPINKTLRPCREESVDFDNTENLYIEGDNLEVLKLLQETYLGKVKMIYIDPPYNTGNDFVYEDDFKQSAEEYIDNSGQLDEEGNRLVANTESNGRFHTDWLNMIYPRLKLAKDLLSEDGVIFISIDDNEVDNLRKICDEIFGESNFIGNLSVENNPKGRKNSDFISVSSEYCLIYANNKIKAHFRENIPKKASDMILDSEGQYVHNSGKRVLVGENSFNKKVTKINSDKNYSVYYNSEIDSIVLKKEEYGEDDEQLLLNGYVKFFSYYNKQLVENTYTEEKFRSLFENNALQFSNDKIYEKNFNDTIRMKSQLVNKEYEAIVNGQKKKWSMELTTTGAGTYLKKLFDLDDVVFKAPKNIGFLKILISLLEKNSCLILDFFSGSATTADAVMRLNAEDGGKRKFIMVQLQEECAEDSEAYKAGYKNICEIGKERIRRAGKKIKEENPLTTQDLDIGFRVLKCDSSNMEDVYFTPKEYMDKQQSLFVDNIKKDRSDEDLLFDAMLKLDTPLSSKIEKITIAGKTVYNVAQGHLMACFDKNVTDEVITAIAKEMPSYFVMRDSSQADDSVAINFEQIFNTYSPQTVRRVL